MSYSHCRISVVVSTLTTVNMSYSHCLIDEMIYSWVRNLMRVTAVIMRYCEQPATRVGIRLFYYDRTLCTGQSFIEIKKKFWLSTFYQLGSRAAGVTAHQPAEHLHKYLTKPFSSSFAATSPPPPPSSEVVLPAPTMFRAGNYIDNSCLRCRKTVYPTDKIGPLKDYTFFHSGCFRCIECNSKLTLKTYFNNQVGVLKLGQGS